MLMCVDPTGCRRSHILAYFGEKSPLTCGNCDNCLREPRRHDKHINIAVFAGYAVELVKLVTTRQHDTESSLTVRIAAEVMWGSKGKHIYANGLDRLPQHGLAKLLFKGEPVSFDDVAGMLQHLVMQEIFGFTASRHIERGAICLYLRVSSTRMSLPCRLS